MELTPEPLTAEQDGSTLIVPISEEGTTCNGSVAEGPTDKDIQTDNKTPPPDHYGL